MTLHMGRCTTVKDPSQGNIAGQGAASDGRNDRQEKYPPGHQLNADQFAGWND